MKSADTRAFVNQFVILLLVTLGCGGSVGLGTVWLRHQISTTAETNRALATQLAAVERRISEFRALVDVEQSPEALRQRNADWHLGLVAIADAQTLHVADDPIARLATRDYQSISTETPGRGSFRVALGQ